MFAFAVTNGSIPIRFVRLLLSLFLQVPCDVRLVNFYTLNSSNTVHCLSFPALNHSDKSIHHIYNNLIFAYVLGDHPHSVEQQANCLVLPKRLKSPMPILYIKTFHIY